MGHVLPYMVNWRNVKPYPRPMPWFSRCTRCALCQPSCKAEGKWTNWPSTHPFMEPLRVRWASWAIVYVLASPHPAKDKKISHWSTGSIIHDFLCWNQAVQVLQGWLRTRTECEVFKECAKVPRDCFQLRELCLRIHSIRTMCQHS